MLSWEILHRFTEGMHKESVVWFKEDFYAVLKGKKDHNQHLEVESHFDIVKQAIEEPNEVRQDKDYSNRKCYYAWFSGGRDFPNQHMKVVLEHTWYGKIRVLTAYFTSGLNSGEKTIWSKIQNSN